MKKVGVFSIGILYACSGAWYISHLFRGEIEPTPATWLMFACATTIYVASLVLAKQWDWYGGSLGSIDVIYCASMAIAIFMRVGVHIKLQPFEYYYFAAAGLVVIFWAGMLARVGVEKSSFATNLAVNGLIGAGYLPTAQKILAYQRNTETFFTWYAALAAGVISLFLVARSRKILPKIYSLRTVVMVAFLLYLMYRYN